MSLYTFTKLSANRPQYVGEFERASVIPPESEERQRSCPEALVNMPCSKPNHHKPWPTSGVHTLRIEACETICGWCHEDKGAANNLRVVSFLNAKLLSDAESF
jgi:hypothetical protein